MAKDGELTPMRRQYLDMKKEHQDEVLFFRLGDFYEMFDDDAIEVSHLLNLTLTHRQDYPMCGIPYHAAKNYLKRLLDAGKKVAICDQVLNPDRPNDLAKREVIQIYTPGTVVEDEYLEPFSSNTVLSVCLSKNTLSVAYSDMSTGDFQCKALKAGKNLESLGDMISSLTLREIIVADDQYFTDRRLRDVLDLSGVMVTKMPISYFSPRDAEKFIKKHFGCASLQTVGLGEKDPCVSPSGALLRYFSEMAKSELEQIKRIEVVTDDGKLLISESAKRNLEIVGSMTDGKGGHTLYSAINRTVTASGARLLKETLLNPLSDKAKIDSRLSWVEFLYSNTDERKRVRTLLSSSSDLIRLSAKFEMDRSVSRDLMSIGESLSAFFSLASEHDSYLELLSEDLSDPDALVSLLDEITKAINPECTNLQHEGKIIIDGYSEELDALRKTQAESLGLLDGYLEKVKAETGLTILKLGYNKIIGHFLEIPKGQVSKAPESFIRRQTLVGGERYTTAELQDLEERIANAGEESLALEKRIYESIVRHAKDRCADILSIGNLFAKLDLYQSFADAAALYNYVKPEITEGGEVEIIGGRHPVVERNLPYGAFTSNDLESAKGRFILLTGPNMAGKSTYLRQNALIVLLAHVGSFVPAKKATIPLFDRIFCRVGASDNLAKGESTFMVEMQESAYILRNATRKSLVIMDEVGRGTSTQDGMAIAYAMMEYLKDAGAVTLFATHYHELTMLDTDGIRLMTLSVSEEKNHIEFLRKVIDGVSASSYGLHVASLAGVPQSVLRKAQYFQRKHFASYQISDDGGQMDLFIGSSKEDGEEGGNEDLVNEILDFDVSSSTPLDALVLISSLQNKLKG